MCTAGGVAWGENERRRGVLRARVQPTLGGGGSRVIVGHVGPIGGAFSMVSIVSACDVFVGEGDASPPPWARVWGKRGASPDYFLHGASGRRLKSVI